MLRFSSASTAFELHHDLKPFSRLFPILLDPFRNTLQRRAFGLFSPSSRPTRGNFPVPDRNGHAKGDKPLS